MKLLFLLSILLYSISTANELNLSGSPEDWKIESISIKKSNDSEEVLKHLGDYVVVAKFRNVSKQPIKVATNHIYTFISSDQLSEEEFTLYMQERNRIHHMCCHPPTFVEIAPNEAYTVSCRNSSRFNGKIISLSTSGENGSVTLGTYTLKLTK